MTAVLGRGTCGGHVTLLFTVDDLDEDPIKQGSLGAGLCLTDGAEAIARGELGVYSLDVKFLHGNGDAKIFQHVLDLLSEEISEISDYSWEIAVRNKLPSSQGFGMSAAVQSQPRLHSKELSDYLMRRVFEDRWLSLTWLRDVILPDSEMLLHWPLEVWSAD